MSRCATYCATTTTSAPSATTTTEPPVECPPAPYEFEFLPVEVGNTTLDPDEIEPDVWTSVGGTQTIFWGHDDGTVAIALVRGTLPPVDWPNEKGNAEVGGTPVAVFNLGDRYCATHNTCLHQQGPLGEGTLEENVVTCPLHGWQYNVETGECLTAPGLRVATLEVKVEGDDVFVQV